MRVGEVCGLRWQDLDFEKREISINHNLIYTLGWPCWERNFSHLDAQNCKRDSDDSYVG